MNFRERTLTRRQLLAGAATVAAGFAAGSLPFSQRQAPRLQTTRLLPDPKPPRISLPEVPEETAEVPRPHHLRYTLPHEEKYAEYIHSLGLSYIAPFELLRAHRNTCNGISNTLPPQELWSEMGKTLMVADELRRRLDRKMLYINSAYRSPEYNRVIPGSASRSYHIKNCALDLVYDCPPQQVVEEARKMRAEGVFKGGLGLYSSFVHLDTRGSNAIWSRV